MQPEHQSTAWPAVLRRFSRRLGLLAPRVIRPRRPGRVRHIYRNELQRRRFKEAIARG